VPEYFSFRVRGAARPERLAYCRIRLLAQVEVALSRVLVSMVAGL
jgi:hypothetical protein